VATPHVDTSVWQTAIHDLVTFAIQSVLTMWSHLLCTVAKLNKLQN